MDRTRHSARLEDIGSSSGWLVVTTLITFTVVSLADPGLASGEPAAQGSVAFTPVADTSIGYRDPGTDELTIMPPRGEARLLDLTWKAPATQSQSERPETAHVLMAFDLSDLPPGTLIGAASLELEVIGQSSLDTRMSRVTSAWDEATTTWDDRPSYDEADPVLVVDLPARSRSTIDVTELVSTWVEDPTANHGLALVPSGAGRHVTKLASREHANPQVRPKLVIETLETDALVEPIFECAERAGDGSFRAYFGYHNRALDESGRPTPLDVPVGEDNRFEPDVHEDLLPDHFEVPYAVDDEPGRTAPGAQDPSAFVIEEWDGAEPVSWHLLGQTATASIDTLCSDARPPSPTTRIQQAYDRGHLSAGEAAIQHLLAAANPDALDPAFRPADGDEDVDPTWWWLGEAWEHLSAQEHAAIDQLLAVQEDEAAEPSTLHSDAGDPGLLQASGDDDCGARIFRVAGHPFNCRAVIDTGTFEFEVLYLGTSRPLAVQRVIDQTVVAVDHYAGLGFARPTGFRILMSPAQRFGGLSLPAPLAGSGTVLLGTDPGVGLVHHEIFHQVQYEYIGWRRLNDARVRWWLEASAEWATHQLDRLRPSPTFGYASELHRFLATPSARLDSTSDLVGGREYGAFILAEYLDHRAGGAQAIVRSWETIGEGILGKAPIDAVHDELTGSRSLTEFWVWSYVLSRDQARAVGFDEPDVPAWRTILQTNPATSAATSASARPARADTRTLLPGGAASGDLGVAPGGAAYVDLSLAGSGAHVLTFDVASRSRQASDLHVAAIPFGEYPALCGPVSTGQLVDGTLELEVNATAGCSSVTLALVNEARPGRFGGGSVKVDWQVGAETRIGGDTVFVAGVGRLHDANAFVVSVLRSAGYEVESGPTIPEDLSGIGQLWWIDWENRPSAEDVPRLEAFVNEGGGLYLTGERPCCEPLNERVSEIVNQLVLDGPVQVGGLGDPPSVSQTMATNPNALGGLTSTPHDVPSIRVAAPGGMAGVGGVNVLASTSEGVPIAAVWEGEHLTGSGHLVVVMDINWLDSGTGRGPLAADLVENIALFLSKLPEPPDPPGIPVSLPDQEPGILSEAGEPLPTAAGGG
jgi:hypothetical protein